MNTQSRQVALVSALMLAMSFSSACKERVPAANTPEFYKLHGIVNDGKTTNEITLVNDRNSNRPKLRFPPEVGVAVETPGTHDPEPTVIRKGFARVAEVWLELDKQKRLIPITETPDHLIFDKVRIRFSASQGPHDIQKTEARLREIAQLSVRTTDKPELGLREYVLVAPKTDLISQYEYVPTDESFRSMDGERMWIGCQSTGGSITTRDRPSGCASSFNHPSGASVAYQFEFEQLPYWQKIYGEVYKFTDSVIVK